MVVDIDMNIARNAQRTPWRKVFLSFSRSPGFGRYSRLLRKDKSNQVANQFYFKATVEMKAALGT